MAAQLEAAVERILSRVKKLYLCIYKNDAVELGWSRDVSTLGSAIIVRGALIDGAFYDIKLEWRTSTQNFEIVGVEKSL